MKKIISYILLVVCIPIVLILGMTVFKAKQYAFTILALTLLSCAAFALSFEQKEQSVTKLIIIAVMTALSVVGRFIFAAVPGFKPVTALVVITAMYFGPQAGFMTGATTALISNFYFGQGTWTPFQMFTWGLIGLVGGLMAEELKSNRLLLCLFGALSGVAFSLIMDIYTVLWQDNGFNLSRYAAALVSGMKFTVIYAVSNVIFLLLLAGPIGKTLQRVKNKYGI
ncbi:MAG: ECF transporter S component [Acutalibacteraceae bacterium]|nr:ECF transporter S component [Oscillospiraceae bacterium]